MVRKNHADWEKRKMHLPLPQADAVTVAEVRDWLDRFAACVREVDYAAARPFWHPDVVIFGTYQELVKSLSAWTERQWNNVWPRTADFRFDLASTMVMAAPDGAMAVAIAPWTSSGFHEDGMRFDRPGRATIVLAKQSDGRWLGVHSHMSLARGVPQDSHGKRLVKAR
jgi:ketosteroid isomerase-like protein